MVPLSGAPPTVVPAATHGISGGAAAEQEPLLEVGTQGGGVGVAARVQCLSGGGDLGGAPVQA